MNQELKNKINTLISDAKARESGSVTAINTSESTATGVFNITADSATIGLPLEGWQRGVIKVAKAKPREGNPDIEDALIGFELPDQDNKMVWQEYPLTDVNAGQRYHISVANMGKIIKATGIGSLTSYDDLKLLKGKQLEILVKHSTSAKTGRVFVNVNGFKGV